MATSMSSTCDVCSKSFLNNSTLNRHKKLMHDVDVCRRSFQCDVCEDKPGFSFYSHVLRHYISCHNFQVEKTNLEFPSFSEFIAWKTLQEKKSFSKFVKTTGSKRLANKTVAYYYICHRSGTHEDIGKGLRQPKSQGSCKIGKFCLASIEAYEADGKVRVTYQSRHYGHDMDIRHLRLTDEERASLAAKLEEGVTIDTILDNIRNNVNGGELERILLTTRKDIRNISQAYGINPQKLHKDDGTSADILVKKDDKTSIDIFVNSLRMKNDNSIRYYKPQDEPDEDGVLMDSEFMLVIMTDPQKRLYESLGNKILIDSTHGTSDCDVSLTTIVCIDDFGSGFPSAFCISTKVDTKSMYQFFLKVQDTVGRIQTQVFMSDDDNAAYYSAWVQAMGPPNQRLLCVWHVDRIWRQNILKLIKAKELQVTMYKSLRVLLECSDQIHLHVLLQAFLQSSSLEIQDFLQYFKDTYASRPEVWADCYRQNCGLSTNTYLESLHKLIKYCYMDGKKNKTIDQIVALLFKVIRDK